MTKLKSRFGFSTEQPIETESYEGQEEIKWNKSRYHNSFTKTPIEVLSDKNQILTKLEQFEKALNTLGNRVNALENIRNLQDNILQ